MNNFSGKPSYTIDRSERSIEKDFAMPDNAVSPELQRIVQPDLEAGEQLLWEAILHY